MVQTVYEMDDIPSALRYPRGSALGLDKLNGAPAACACAGV